MEDRDPLNRPEDPSADRSEEPIDRQPEAIARADPIEEAFKDEAPADWRDLVKPLILNPYFIGFVLVLVFVLSRFW